MIRQRHTVLVEAGPSISIDDLAQRVLNAMPIGLAYALAGEPAGTAGNNGDISLDFSQAGQLGIYVKSGGAWALLGVLQLSGGSTGGSPGGTLDFSDPANSGLIPTL